MNAMNSILSKAKTEKNGLAGIALDSYGSTDDSVAFVHKDSLSENHPPSPGDLHAAEQGIYFRDGHRRIDFVLVFEEEDPGSKKSKKKKKKAVESGEVKEKSPEEKNDQYRKKFLNNLRKDEQTGQLIGFATLPDQVHRKSIKKGFEFTLIVVGETGLGKSTLINSLFLTDLYKDKVVPTAEERISKTVEIKKSTVEIEEKGVKLKLNVIDTPGFGDSLDCSDCWKQVADFIEAQFEQYFRDESGLNRKNITDNRVHCCLYFIPPYGHGLRPLDREFMKRLQDKVNIVPVIAKADTLTPAEVKKLKAKINEEIEKCEIKIYQFPDCDSDEDEEFKQQDNALKACIPFALIGSNTVIEVKGRRVRGRVYPWGVVEVENQDHCDFVKLRNMLVRTHMQDLKDVTRDVHYENYRAQTLQRMNKAVFQRNKLKRDSSPDFANVQETDRIIQEKDEELRRMQEMLARMEQQLEEQKRQSTQTTPKHQLVI